MIHQDKLKVMTRMALYDKKKIKKDLPVHSFDESDYIRLEITKTLISVVCGFVIILGFIMLWNMDAIISNFDTYNYKQIALFAGLALAVLVAAYIWITVVRSRKRYNEVKPRVQRYVEDLETLKGFYEEEEKLREEFEKGEKHDGE